jgi:hypothetical protein
MKKYTELEWKIVLVDDADVITASGEDEEGMFRTDIFF